MTDLIRRADVLAYPIRIDHYDKEHGNRHFVLGIESVMEYVESLPSVELVLQTPQTYGKSINPSNAEVVSDYISRADAIEAVCDVVMDEFNTSATWGYDVAEKALSALPSAEAVQGWIPCSERLPKELEAVNVTWVNHNPPCYYMDIMNVPFTGTCVRYKGKWYWWDSTICDVLGEYGEECGAEPIDKYIEITAWMPLPTPYKGGDSE